MAKVIVLDNVAQEGLDLLDAAEGIECALVLLKNCLTLAKLYQ